MAYDASSYNNNGSGGEYKEYDLSNPDMDEPSKGNKKDKKLSAADRKYYKSLKTRYRGDEHIDFDDLGRRGSWTWYFLEWIWDLVFRR